MLRDGSHVSDPRLDRLPQFDPRSRNYPIRTLLTAVVRPRSYTWSCGQWLDQGREGACVGFAWAHEHAARPAVGHATDDTARALYRRAQQLDEWEGEGYSGTSVLAGAKAAQEAGHLTEYRWAFGIDDLVLALGYKGPAVLGIPWLEGMFNTDPDGYLRVDGPVAGGHAILARAVNLRAGHVVLRNSWGPDWGHAGDARIRIPDLARLLHMDGEACIPLRRIRR